MHFSLAAALSIITIGTATAQIPSMCCGLTPPPCSFCDFETGQCKYIEGCGGAATRDLEQRQANPLCCGLTPPPCSYCDMETNTCKFSSALPGCAAMKERDLEEREPQLSTTCCLPDPQPCHFCNSKTQQCEFTSALPGCGGA